MGLTQEALAHISGLSRSTISALEKRSGANLSIARAEKLLESIGLAMSISPPWAWREEHSTKAPPARSALERAALTASVSYKPGMTARQLEKALVTGIALDAIRPHLHALLDEAPISLLARVVDELHAEKGVEREQVWRQMRHLAQDLHCFRPLWQ